MNDELIVRANRFPRSLRLPVLKHLLGRAACVPSVLLLYLASSGMAQVVPLVPSGVDDFELAAPKVFWHTSAACPQRPPKVGTTTDASNGSGAAAADPEVISRVATYGSRVRQVFVSNEPRSPGVCNPYEFHSNIIADDTSLYWVDNTGLVSLPTSANPGDTPILLSAAIDGKDGSYPAELAQIENLIYALTYDASGRSTLSTIDKTLPLVFSGSPVAAFRSTLQSDDQFFYWLQFPAGDLKRSATSGVTTIATGVTAYYPEGFRRFCNGPLCFESRNVYIGEGPRLSYFNNVDGSTHPIYTSTDPSAQIYSVVTDENNVYLFEDRTPACIPPFCLIADHEDVLVRASRGGASPVALYTHDLHFTDAPSTHLTTDGTFLFWQENGMVLRLPTNAGALPTTNMDITGLEVTQSVQDTSNSVRLIQNKRTFVRVYVKSDGPPVPGVTAQLYGTWNGGADGGGPLAPVNPAGTTLTVYPSPSRGNINDSFLFELPWDWTTRSDLVLRAELNPYHVPLQTSYANNSLTEGPFSFDQSPRLDVQFVAFDYTLNNTTYSPRFVQDILGNYSWIRRAYPLASMPGSFDDPGPGLRTRLWYVSDAGLGSRVAQTAMECTNNLCASAYANKQLDALRKENSLPDNVFMYGMISTGGGFPRGQTCCGTHVSSGPAGDGFIGYYAGHEIGHQFGRGHPQTGNGECCLVGSDPDPAYPHGHIGPDDGSIAGFDSGDPMLMLPPTILRGVVPTGGFSFDLMAYCNPNWISDTNYENIYKFMIANPPPEGSGGAATVAADPVSGDFLHVIGEIAADGTSATVSHVRRLSNVAGPSRRTPGDYSIELLDAEARSLADDSFTPQVSEDSDDGRLSFSEVVPFVSGTRQLRIVTHATNKVLAAQLVSPNPPVVAAVAVANAPDPVTGTVTVTWDASDPDGDPLTFDVLYSRDGGVSLQPLLMASRDTRADIDTARLGGGQAIFRVVASDGVNTFQADSAPFMVADKPPQPRILLPADGVQVHFGQLLNFSGEAEDFQDGSVSGASLRWTTERAALGEGSLYSVDDLPVGTNLVTLTATNSAGLSATTTITIFVDDDLALPGPTLSSAPTQISWNVEAGATQIQTSLLDIGNSGSGELMWEAQSDQPWLTLDASSGTGPGTLTVNADPSGFAAGTDNQGHVLLTVVGEPSQSTSIPVHLFVGNIFAGPPAPCVGDCNGDNTVTVDEIITGVNISLGRLGVEACPSFDSDDDGTVTVAELVRAVSNALNGSCLAPYKVALSQRLAPERH